MPAYAQVCKSWRYNNLVVFLRRYQTSLSDSIWTQSDMTIQHFILVYQTLEVFIQQTHFIDRTEEYSNLSKPLMCIALLTTLKWFWHNTDRAKDDTKKALTIFILPYLLKKLNIINEIPQFSLSTKCCKCKI